MQGRFVTALAADFEQHGATAIQAMRERDPASYIRVIASLRPKELDIGRPLDGLTDEELAAGISSLLSLGAAAPNDEPGDGGLH